MHQNIFPDPFLILVNNPKKLMHARNSFDNKILWKKIIKKSLNFFCLSHLVSFYGQSYENVKGPGAIYQSLWVTKQVQKNTFSVIYNLHYFDDLIQSVFWVVPKITFANLGKPIQDFIIISVSFDPLNLENVEGKKKQL